MSFEKWVSGDVTLYRGDCLEVLPTLGKVDAVITDPPYGIGGSHGAINMARGKGNYVTSFADSPEYIRSVVIPVVSMCRSMATCVVLTPGNTNLSAYPQPDSFGAFYQPAAVGLSRFGNLDAQPIFYYGSNPRKQNMGVTLSYKVTEIPENNGHPCVKPIGVWTRVVESVTLNGHTVLDPFMGSGTTGVACVKLGRKFIGIEICEDYFNVAKRRILAAQNDAPLFDAPKSKQASFATVKP